MLNRYATCLLVLSVMPLAGMPTTPATAREKLTEHTMAQDDAAKAAAATIADAAWLEGHWTGEGLGGRCEEIWTAPEGNQMLGVYRQLKDDMPAFFEILTITEEEGGLMLRIKHFDPNLRGWEEKDVTQDFRLLAFTETELFFDRITFKRTGRCNLEIYVAMNTDSGPREELFSLSCAAPPPGMVPDESRRAFLTEELWRTETAFARTMADRDLDMFAGFLAEDTVFFTAETELRGREAVVSAWKGLFSAPKAPFSWAPEAVSVLDSGELGLSSGPIHDPGGNRVGTYNSVWRREPDGSWKIIFDRGCPPCDSVPEPGAEEEKQDR